MKTKPIWTVIVSNVGLVYTGNMGQAKRYFAEYVTQAKYEGGRMGGESVTLMKDGEPFEEYVGTQDARGTSETDDRN